MSNKVKLTLVTPEMAAKWLREDPGKRHKQSVSQAHVDRIAAMIKRDGWKFNGDTIKFLKDGTIIDGYHRLAAVIAANKPIETFIVYLDKAPPHIPTMRRCRPTKRQLAILTGTVTPPKNPKEK